MYKKKSKRNLIRIKKSQKVSNRVPITNSEIEKMRDIPISIDSFKSKCRRYYSTKQVGLLLYIECLLTGKKSIIDFSPSSFDYLNVTTSVNTNITFSFRCLNVRDLFIKLRRHKIL